MKRGFVLIIAVFIILAIIISSISLVSAPPHNKVKVKDLLGTGQNNTIPMASPFTCSQAWGGDCSEQPPESFDNTFDSCDNGFGTDESINEIYLNQSEYVFGDRIIGMCNIMIYGIMALALNDSTMGDGCEWGWQGDKLNILYRNSPTGEWTKVDGYSQVFSCLDYSFNFPVDNVAGVHQVRCAIGYKLGPNDECGEGQFYDNDDINFTVYSEPQYISITISGGTPIDFGDSNVPEPQQNQPAVNNPLQITIDSNFNFDITAKSDSPDFVSASNPSDTFPVSSMQWATGNPISSPLTPYTTSEAIVYQNEFVNKIPTVFPIYHTITVPQRQVAGTYNAGITITAKRTGS